MPLAEPGQAEVDLWMKRTVLVAAVWGLIFSVLLMQRQNRFGTFAFDLAIYDQAIWLISHGRNPFLTIRGLNLWAHHVNINLYFYVPFYWLGLGPNFLNTTMVVSTALCAIPIHKISVSYLQKPIYGTIFALLFLWNPTTQFLMFETFHPEVMAMLPLFGAWWMMVSGRRGMFILCCIYAVMWKEDVTLFVAMIGFVLLVAQRGQRLLGLFVGFGASLWFLVQTKLILGHFSPGGAFYNSWFGDLGTSIPEITFNLLRHPEVYISAVRQEFGAAYVWKMFTPWGFLPLLAPLTLLLALPQFSVNILANQTFIRDYRYHYSGLVLVGLSIATIVAIKNFGATNSRRLALVFFVAICGVRTGYLWGVGPLTKNFESGYWAPNDTVRIDAIESAIQRIPDGAGVSASYFISPHIAHRQYIYDFPNPFVEANWGATGKYLNSGPKTSTAEYILVETTRLGNSTQLFEDLVGTSGDYKVIFFQDGIALAVRSKD